MQPFVYSTLYKQFFEHCAEWFEVLGCNHLVLWHVEDGHKPTLAEARSKLKLLDENGETADAFGWDYALGFETAEETG